MKMEKLEKIEKEELLKKLKEKFCTDEIEYLGCRRFSIRMPYLITLDDGKSIQMVEYLLTDQEGNSIPLVQRYNGIFMFTHEIAVVCIRTDIRITDGRLSQQRKDGIIDIDGNELLPCIYDANGIHIHLDGFVEISKDEVHKFTNIIAIKNGEFNWDTAALSFLK
jgi:hypothetical protein